VASGAVFAQARAPSLGAASSFAVLAGTAVTCTDGTVTGNVGVYPGTAITQTSCPVTGNINRGDSTAAQAEGDFLTAYGQFATLHCDQTFTDTTLGNHTFRPGVYCFEAALTSGGVWTLDGPADGIWIFKIGTLGTGALTGTGLSVVNAIGAPPPCKNVYWWVSQAVTMTDSAFAGTILAGAAITLTRGTFNGDALAKAAVTITGTKVSGDCAAAPQCTEKVKFEGTVNCAKPIDLTNGSFFLTDGTRVVVDGKSRIEGKSEHDDKIFDRKSGHYRGDGCESGKINSLAGLKQACERGQTVQVKGSGSGCADLCPRTVHANKVQFKSVNKRDKDDDHDDHDRDDD